MSQFKHECWEWDGLEIDENDVEFFCCRCFGDDPEAIRHAERQQRFLDEIREKDNAPPF